MHRLQRFILSSGHPKPKYCTQVPARHFTESFRVMAAKEYKLKGVTSLALSLGDKQEVEVEGVENGKVVLLNAAGKVQAVGAKCTHYGAPLAKGVLTKSGYLRCPWHGACFNAKTGDVEDAPALDALPVFDVAERDGAVYITGEESAIKSSRRSPNFKCSAAPGSAQEDPIVVVGGGSGALGAVEGLREKGYKGALTVISNEGYLPIDRPKLSKALISDTSKIAWRDKAWFEAGGVQWVEGEVTAVNFSDRHVETKSGGKIAYSKLILATGGTPRKLPLEGFKTLSNIFTLRNAHDVKKIVDTIGSKGKNIVIVGSSFIGMEVAVATAADNSVSVIGMESVPLERVLGKDVGAGVQKIVQGKGVKFYSSASVDKAVPSESDPSAVGAVLLKDGTRLDADLVILGVGVAPSTEYLKENSSLQLEKDGSIKVDQHFSVVGQQGVYAVGDIATYPYHGPGGEGKPVRIEHWNVAQNAGRAAATHIVSSSVETSQFIPVFWSALGSQLRYCGNTANGWDDLVLDGSPGDAKFVAYYTKGDTVVAMASMGRDPLMVQSAELMRFGNMPTKANLQANLDLMSIGVPA
ncbi:unnamed protein product [Clonostachys chloroleuca]|uniref:Rieske domain-containing protein n=1 Tax=Clonostachys chloroleuca TaxID=1926264 RepID=A0AA35QCU9_9HYPO|nr:unnamed protein product [Clonostachys chloroleuca]